MRVLMLNYEFPPLGGGAANANKYLLNRLGNRDDLEIDLVTSSPDEDKVERFAENTTVHRLDVSKEDVHYWTQPEIARYTWRALRYSRQLQQRKSYDLVHAWFGVPCGVIARLLGAPYLVALRGSDVPGYNERFSFQYVFLKPIIKKVWSDADAVVANSEGLRELARKTAQPGIDVIPNGVDVSEFQPKYETDGPFQVLCVARLIERKGIKYLIDAVADVEGTELVLVGEGDREEALKQRVRELGIRERVTFAGYVAHDQISQYYECADVFVLPSFNEGMSNTVLEAMAAGLPVVVTETGGTAELVDDNGIVIPMRSTKAIADALVRYRDGRDLQYEQGQNSREQAEKMSWKAVANEYYRLYRKIC